MQSTQLLPQDSFRFKEIMMGVILATDMSRHVQDLKEYERVSSDVESLLTHSRQETQQ